MDYLKDLLLDINLKNIDAHFAKIAESLMCNHVIKKGDDEYAIVEIEFYLYSCEHKDVITYPRDTEAGQWFFHQSGVDLTFKSRGVRSKNDKVELIAEDACFGGILIRAIKPKEGDSSDIIWGPYKVVDVLWDKFNALSLDGIQYPHLIEKPSELNPLDLLRYKRWIDIADFNKRDAKIIEWRDRVGKDIDIDVIQYRKDVLDEVKSATLQSSKYMYRCICLPKVEIETITTAKYGAKPRHSGLPVIK